MKYLLSFTFFLITSFGFAWTPEKFEVFCGTPLADTATATDYLSWVRYADSKAGLGYVSFYDAVRAANLDPDVPGNPACITEARKQMTENYAAEIWQKLKALKFTSPSPKRLSPVFKNAAGQDVVRLYAVENASFIARTTGPCIDEGRQFEDRNVTALRFDTQKLDSAPPMQLYYIIAHELIHVVQSAQAIGFEEDTDNCMLPGWITEGTADALAVYLTHQRFKSYYPPISTGIGKNIHGLRPYDKNLAWKNSEKLPDYRSSSFWHYLADRYYGGKYDYLAIYMGLPDLNPGKDDWFDWLDTLLLNSDEIKKVTRGGLYLIYPDFLANYANWGNYKYPHITQEEWLQTAFGGCHSVTLNPGQNTRGLSFELEPLSGQCVRVVVGGLQAGQYSAVKLLAQDTSTDNLDNLHLATANMTSTLLGFPETFNCYTLSKKYPQGTCLEKPFTGAKAQNGVVAPQGSEYAKTWLSLPQETATGSYENLFIVTHSPRDASDAKHANRAKQKVRLQIGLETSSLQNTAKGTAKNAQGTVMNGAASNADGLGDTPTKGGEATGDLTSIMTDPEMMSQMMFLMPGMPADMGSAMTSGGFTGIPIVSIQDVSFSPEYEELEPSLSFSVQLMPPGIPFGASGVFTGMASGGIDPQGQGGPENIFFPWPVAKEGELPDNGQVEVLEYSETLLHLKVSGTVCLWGNLVRDSSGMVVDCRKVDSFSGEIIKPFGWLYDQQQVFTSIDTPGMEIYRKDLLSSLASSGFPFPQFPDDVNAADEEAEAGENPSTSGTVGEVYTCECSCEEYAELERMSIELETLPEGSMPPDTIMQMMQCIPACMMQYAQCGE